MGEPMSAQLPPEDDLRRLVFRVIEHLAIDGTTIQHDSPPTAAFAGEWLGPRKGVDRNAPEPDLSEAEKFHKLGQDVGDQSSVLLFIHGGNLTFGGPVPYRPLLQRLTAYEAIRCFTPAYRLAPKDAFPSALIDVLSAYLYLLSAPPGSFHQPIPASRVIFAGESAGCSLMFALVKVLLTAKKLGVSHVQFHGASIPLDLPAGITAFASYCDFTTCLPSERLNMDNDVFVPTMLNPANDPAEADEAVNWPSNPPRHDFTCYQSALDHPLVSPIAVEDWSGAPPMWMCAGGHERPLDSGKVVAKRAHQSGVPVRFEVFDELPHIWFAFLPQIPASKRCFTNWAKAMRDMRRREFTSHAITVNSWTLVESSQSLDTLCWFPLEHVAMLMKAENLNRRPVTIRTRSQL